MRCCYQFAIKLPKQSNDWCKIQRAGLCKTMPPSIHHEPPTPKSPTINSPKTPLSPNHRRLNSAPRVPTAPLPECPATFKLTHTSIGSRDVKKKEPRAITEFQELERLAQSEVNMALKCPPLSVAPGPYSLTIHTTSPVSLPPRKSFLTGVRSSIVVNKRWKRSQVSILKREKQFFV
jgi:hypothetical protein